MLCRRFLVPMIVLAVGFPLSWAAAQPGMMTPRVPPDKLAEARAMKNPLPESSDLVAKGKALYEGKGTCVNCHGPTGMGDGPVAASLTPKPRNFHHRGFWRHRSEGEIFWVIKHGIPGTAMIDFKGVLTDEEIWAVIRYEKTFAEGPAGRDETEEMPGRGERGPGGKGMAPMHEREQREGMGGMMEGREGMGGMGGMGGEECCKKRESKK